MLFVNKFRCCVNCRMAHGEYIFRVTAAWIYRSDASIINIASDVGPEMAAPLEEATRQVYSHSQATYCQDVR